MESNSASADQACAAGHEHAEEGHAGKVSRLRRAGRFLWHFAQMVLAMMAGMAVYHGLLNTVFASTGFALMTRAYPLFGYWMMTLSMVLPMVALMLLQKHGTRYCGEMTAAMLAPTALLTLLMLCRVIGIGTVHGLGDPLMILAMAGYSLYRFGEHSPGGHRHVQGVAADAASTAADPAA